MSEEKNWLLTDEFLAFAATIKSLYDRKKAKKVELKNFYDKITADLNALDAQAKDAEDDFQAWKKSQEQEVQSQSLPTPKEVDKSEKT